ncbi:MAG: DUF1800 domain-containing protein [Candidatus Pseudobacter hemicellulosilyticus]|uniref:DUF1800 domain-containing protein n=1 Tax=Candidatus Pseudobacter hemicellulosilyticus TaxID=3121375 RepID=A0AAJ6BJE4_9BACT|nr:MAG: DUF1800 domain-containing protein [Pseudobacter sp.]
MAVSNQVKQQHLLWRAGFGPGPADYPQLTGSSPKALLTALFKASEKTPAYIDVADSTVKELSRQADIRNSQRSPLTEEERKLLRERSREGLKSINLVWLGQMATSGQQLREKMALFWHGHFATRTVNVLYQQQLLDLIRRHALGNFTELLRSVSKSAAMLNFLNNNQNRKGRPNENFAREVMELFTMGRGHYTENDVKEAARAFTGWGATTSGDFLFRKNQHDEGSKTVLGKTGNFNGDDVLDILTGRRETASFITRKIYRYFVNESVDENNIQWLADRFYQSQYDISALLQDIFSSSWFYDPKNIGCRIKSPVELIVGIRRALPMRIANEDIQINLQKLLGQQLFYPPNVAGWPGGTNWIDSSSLMLRLRIPQMIYAEDELNLKPKDDDDLMMGMKDKPRPAGNKGGQVITASIDWKSYEQFFTSVPREKLVSSLARLLLQAPNSVAENVLDQYVDASSRETFIRTATIQLMSTPEYQLC